MFFSLTGLAYFILFLSLGLLTFRFFQYWRRKRDVIAKLFLFFVIPFTLFALVRAVSILFFAQNLNALLVSILLVVFLQSLAAAIVAYLVFYLKLPKVSPWLGFLLVFLFGLAITVLTSHMPYEPSLGAGGVISWKLLPSELSTLYSILRLVIILLAFLPLIIIFLQQFLSSQEVILKKRALGLSLILIFGILLGLIDFILSNLSGWQATILRDYLAITISLLVFLTVFFTQKPPAPSKEYQPPSYPKIQW